MAKLLPSSKGSSAAPHQRPSGLSSWTTTRSSGAVFFSSKVHRLPIISPSLPEQCRRIISNSEKRIATDPAVILNLFLTSPAGFPSYWFCQPSVGEPLAVSWRLRESSLFILLSGEFCTCAMMMMRV